MKVTNPLQRGKACLGCRKRKMRCDGVRPACSQCSKGSRDDGCHYEDKRQISHTEKLRAKVAKLEARLRELETEHSTGSSTSGTPAPQSPGASSSSSMGGDIFLLPAALSVPPSVPPSLTGSPEVGTYAGLTPPGTSHQSSSLSPLTQSPWLNDFLDIPLFVDDPFNSSSDYFSNPAHSRVDPYSPPLNNADDLDTFCQSKQQLLDLFLQHRHQCAFDLHAAKFRASLSGPPQQRPHPALVDAMCLMGCYFSRNQTPQHSAREPHFLQNALSGISSALQHNDRLVQVVQASCLIAVYFFSRGRVLEGYYHSSTAARLAVSLGLHQTKSEDWYQLQLDVGSSANAAQPTFITFKSSLQLTAPRDSVEYAERVAAFWQVFLVDRAWSVASGLPAALPDDDSPRAQIETAWPLAICDAPHPVGDVDPLTGHDNLKLLPSLRAKVVTLFERTFRLSSKTFQNDNLFRIEHRSLDMSLSQFAANLAPLSSLMFQEHLSANDIELVSIHTLMNASIIHLHRDFLEFFPASYQRCLQAANAITDAIQELGGNDYDFLNPILSTAWKCAAHVYLQALAMQFGQMMADKTLVDDMQLRLNTLLVAMRSLGRLFAVSAQDADKTESAIAMTRSNLYVR